MSEILPFGNGGLSPFGDGLRVPGSYGTGHGSADWLKPPQAKKHGLHDGLGLLFARGTLGLLRYPVFKHPSGTGQRHAIVCAPSRSGKGVGFVLPNLLSWPGSCFCIDPKGENAHFTAPRRRLDHNVYVLDPCGISGQEKARFNPLDWLKRSKSFDEDLRLIVEALTPAVSGTEDIWNQGARDLLLGVLCYLIAWPDERPTLGRAYEIFNGTDALWERTLKGMRNCDGGSASLNTKARRAGNWYDSLHDEHKQYHRGTVQHHLSWLGVDSAREMLEHSDFDVREIKDGKASVYVCVPPLSLHVFEGFTRLLTTLTIKAVMAREARDGELPILFMLDEFATTVGKMKAFENAFTVIASYGGRFAVILQTIDQLQSLYPERRSNQSWKTVVENSGLQLFFDAKGDTAKYVSEALGPTTKTEHSPIGGPRQVQRPLLFPNEVSYPVDDDGCHVPDAVFAFVDGLPPILSRRLVSYRDAEFATLYDHRSRIPEVHALGRTEYELARMGKGAGVLEPLEDANRAPLPEPPDYAPSDLEDLRRQSAWDDF